MGAREAEPSIVVAGPAVPNAAAAKQEGSGAAVFHPTGTVSDDTLVVIPNDDGTLPFGLTSAEVEEFAALSPTSGDAALATLIPPEAVAASAISPAAINSVHPYTATAVWSAAYSGNNIWGWDDTARVSYTFSVTEATNQQAAGQGLGHYRGDNGSEMAVWSAWYGFDRLAEPGA